MNTQIPMTNGHNVGIVMGVASGMVMGPAKALMGVSKVLIGAQPIIHRTTPAGHTGSSPTSPAGV
jgi:hypothetical protein